MRVEQAEQDQVIRAMSTLHKRAGIGEMRVNAGITVRMFRVPFSQLENRRIDFHGIYGRAAVS
jgi:hypothetical protein